MRHEKTINIPFNDLSAWQDFLDGKGDGTLSCVKTFTAVFGDKGEGHVEVDIKVCDGGKDGTPFVDPLLCQDNCDAGCLDVTDTIAGEYVFDGFLKDTYVVIIPDSIEAAKEGQRQYRAIEQWLQSLPYDQIMLVANLHVKSMIAEIDINNNIDTILSYCENDDELFERIYKLSQDGFVLPADADTDEIVFHASGKQAFTSKNDHYLLTIVDGTESTVSKPHSTKEEVLKVMDEMKKDHDNYDVYMTGISVPSGTKIELFF
jgi:hypothetical protein